MIEKDFESVVELRKKRKMTQRDLARVTGLNIRTISRFENGETISATSEKKIYIALGYDFLQDTDLYLEKVKRSFDKQASGYNEYTLLTDNKYLSRILNIGYPFKDKRVLDLGCGTGLLSLSLADKAKDIVALDISNGMINSLKAKIKKREIKNINAIKGDIHNTEFPDNFFDTIVCVLSFHHFHDISRVMQILKRILKPFGEIIVVDIYSSSNEGDQILQNTCEKIRDFSHNKFFTLKELKELLKDFDFGGFEVEKFEVKRNYKDWIKMANFEDSDKILFNLLKGLALNGISMGSDLRLEENTVKFTQNMVTIKAINFKNF
ncbi:MAG: methyltransferase domain-containing protein [Cetobacterium somerae]|uniref:methyltransferase domain-containing protein n=1 Tax=Cetobacterium somerae TaxID=188913 RepID=UPI003F369B92